MAYLQVTKLWFLCAKDPRPQWKIAADCGFGATTLSAYIHGKKAIPLRHLYSLCESFKVDAEDLLGWTDLDTALALEEAGYAR